VQRALLLLLLLSWAVLAPSSLNMTVTFPGVVVTITLMPLLEVCGIEGKCEFMGFQWKVEVARIGICVLLHGTRTCVIPRVLLQRCRRTVCSLYYSWECIELFEASRCIIVPVERMC
jgi:hypothetical protein